MDIETYNHPSSVGTYVMSETQTLLGASILKFYIRRFGAAIADLFTLVVFFHDFLIFELIEAFFISLATLGREH